MTDGKPTLNLIKASLYHDIPEHIFGDIPYSAKRDYASIAGVFEALEDRWMKDNRFRVFLTQSEKLILEWADRLDLILFCLDEKELGNKSIERVFDSGVLALQGLDRVENGKFMLDDILKRWNCGSY